MKSPPIHVVGAGGIGVALGFSLARNGCDVLMIESQPDKCEYGKNNGLVVDGYDAIKVPFSSFDEWTATDEALTLLCTKTFDNTDVLSKVSNKQKIIPVQNGYDVSLDANSHFGEGIASFVSECERDRPVTRITRDGEFHLGPRRTASEDEMSILSELSSMLKDTPLFKVELVDDVLPYKATKLMYNAAISPLAASAGVDNATLLSDKLAKRYFFKLILENYAILKNAKKQMATIGPFHPDTVSKILKTPGLPEIMAVFFKPSLRGTYCSMAPDMGTAHTEISAYNGYLVELAGDDQPCPYNRAAVSMVNTITEQRLSPGYAHLFLMSAALEKLGIGA
jgi:2-dehydropantoate 2-reductase